MRGMFKYSRTDKALVAVVTVVLSIVLTVSNLFAMRLSMDSERKGRIDDCAEAHYCNLTDALEQEDEERFFSNPGALRILKETVLAFEHMQFPYVLQIHQPLEMAGGTFDDAFLYDIQYDEYGNRVHAAPRVNALQVSMNAASVFDIETEDASWFEESDFIGDGRVEMPVYLGAAYRPFAQYGETLDAMYLAKPYRLTVRGFLEAGSSVVNQGEIELLDWTIVMPALRYDVDTTPDRTDEVEYAHQVSLYLQQVGGAFVLPSANETAALIGELADVINAKGMFDLQVLNYPSNSVRIMRQISGEYAGLKAMWCALAAGMVLMLYMKIIDQLYRRNRKRFAIYLANGASYRAIYRELARPVLVAVLAANLLAAVLTEALVGVGYGLAIWLVSLLVTVGAVAGKFRGMRLSDEAILRAM